MMLREVLHACSNAAVAGAALASIGGGVQRKICAEAERNGTSPGNLVAQLVREFNDRACAAVRDSVKRAMRTSETPVLAGLRQILAHALLWRALAAWGKGEPSPDPASMVHRAVFA